MANQAYVPPAEVILGKHWSSRFTIKRMVKVLLRQGQIVPLQVKQRDDDKYEVFPQDPWASDIVLAACELGWPTILITVQTRYEE